MSDFAKEVLSVSLETEMKQSYLDYAMSVIVGRALPDVRDGLKPVHRRVLFAMSELNNSWNSPYKKSARIVGDVIGKYHPHGDTAVYDTIVRMAQPFSLRYMLVDGQGNFGSVDGDAPAAMRYTEIRMSRIAHELLADIDKETVDFTANYDGSEHEPSVLPTRVPNLLVNGSSGIAVGMATNIPPHNLNEVVEACLALSHNPGLTIRDLMTYLPGPDFPTAASINGSRGIVEAYETGRGKIYMRATAHFEEISGSNDRQAIIVTEIPYQVNKAKLIEKIAELVKEKKIEGINGLRDESDKDGMRIVIELRRGEVPEVILNQLYKLTVMQTVFGINMVALVDGQPKLLNLKEVLDEFLMHRREVVTRRTIFELRKARARAHILEGLAVALSNIDEMIRLIRESQTPQIAKEALLARAWTASVVLEMLARGDSSDSRPEGLDKEFGLQPSQQYRLTETQAQAILDLRLHRLTGLEQDKILEEYAALLDVIQGLLHILRSPDRLMEVIREELEAIKAQFGDKRRTIILEESIDLTLEDMIAEEDRVVTFSMQGYVKTQSVSDYRAQRRGGRGRSATNMKEEDVIDNLFVASSHDTLLCFSSHGKVYWQKVYELPFASSGARGKPIVNLLPLEAGEKITNVLPVREYSEDHFIFMATKQGIVKKTPLVDYSRPRANGIIALTLDEGDELISTAVTNGQRDIMLFATSGKAMRFAESDVRAMGRTARGVIGMRMEDKDSIMSMVVIDETTQDILTATESGYGKRTPQADYPRKGRGGLGVISIKTSERNGQVVAAQAVQEEDHLMLITSNGTLVRTRVAEISSLGRNTQGVRLIKLGNKEMLVSVARLEDEGEEDEADFSETETLQHSTENPAEQASADAPQDE
jgi:DNA gyrase subunit A